MVLGVACHDTSYFDLLKLKPHTFTIKTSLQLALVFSFSTTNFEVWLGKLTSSSDQNRKVVTSTPQKNNMRDSCWGARIAHSVMLVIEGVNTF